MYCEPFSVRALKVSKMLGSLGFSKMNETFRADIFLREITDRENRKYMRMVV